MFIDNKYTKAYFKIIVNAKNAKRKKLNGVYYESHHIIPRCMSGTNKKENLVLLTAKENFICHKLLLKMVHTNTDSYFKLLNAFCAFLRKSKHQERNLKSHQYQFLREKFSLSVKRSWEDPIKRNERILKISETKKRKYETKETIVWNKNKTNIYTKETIEKMKKPKTLEHRENSSKALKKYHKENNHPLLGKVGELSPNYGRKNTESTIKKMSESRYLIKKLTCEHCQKTMDPGNYGRYHGDKCKSFIPSP